MKESRAFRIMEMTQTDLITHDDRLLIRAQKSDIGLEQDWKDQTEITHAEGHRVIIDYWRTGSGGKPERVSVKEYETLGAVDKNTYRPQYLRGLGLAEGVSVSFKNNQMDLMICSLMDDWRSRYRMALEYMVDLTERGIIRYKPITSAPDERNRLEAIRNRLKRHGRPTEYEHDILFRGELGRRIRDDLKPHAVHSEGDETLYLQGYKRTPDTRLAVKYYDIGHREQGTGGEYFKLETTLLKEYFKVYDLDVTALTEQPEIQNTLLETLERVLTKWVGCLTWETTVMLGQALQLGLTDRRKAPSMVARAMLRTERTLTERVAELERVQAEHARVQARHDRDIERLKRLAGLE